LDEAVNHYLVATGKRADLFSSKFRDEIFVIESPTTDNAKAWFGFVRVSQSFGPTVG